MILYMNIKDLSGSRATVVGPESHVLDPIRLGARHLIYRLALRQTKVLIRKPYN
jgi:hypothetical protein